MPSATLCSILVVARLSPFLVRGLQVSIRSVSLFAEINRQLIFFYVHDCDW